MANQTNIIPKESVLISEQSINSNLQFELIKYCGFEIIRLKANKYFNASQLCFSTGKNFKRWKDQHLDIILQLQKEVYMQNQGEVIINIRNKDKSGYYLHPDLLMSILFWISREYFLCKSKSISNEFQNVGYNRINNYISNNIDLKDSHSVNITSCNSMTPDLLTSELLTSELLRPELMTQGLEDNISKAVETQLAKISDIQIRENQTIINSLQESISLMLDQYKTQLKTVEKTLETVSQNINLINNNLSAITKDLSVITKDHSVTTNNKGEDKYDFYRTNPKTPY